VSGAALLAAAAPIKERHDGSNHGNRTWKEHGVDSHHSPTNPIAITRRTSQIAIPARNRRADGGPPPTNCPSTRAVIVRFASSLNVSPIADLCALLNRSIVADSGKIVAVGLQPETSTAQMRWNNLRSACWVLLQHLRREPGARSPRSLDCSFLFAYSPQPATQFRSAQGFRLMAHGVNSFSLRRFDHATNGGDCGSRVLRSEFRVRPGKAGCGIGRRSLESR
jgi:hypothetical protein